MCTNAEAFKAEIRSIVLTRPDRIIEMCSLFSDVDTPEKLAEFIDIPKEEMHALLRSAAQSERASQ
jgi:hypothetical protein